MLVGLGIVGSVYVLGGVLKGIPWLNIVEFGSRGNLSMVCCACMCCGRFCVISGGYRVFWWCEVCCVFQGCVGLLGEG